MTTSIVLAAGLGTRMGGSKPLTRWRGRPLLSHVLGRIAAAGLPAPIVVVGRNADDIARTVDLASCRTVVNPAPGDGLSSSLALGLDARTCRPGRAPPVRGLLGGWGRTGLLLFGHQNPCARMDVVAGVTATQSRARKRPYPW